MNPAAYSSEDLLMRPDGFLNQCDQSFLRNYALETFLGLVDREDENRFDHLFDLGYEYEIKYGKQKERAYMVDKLFGVASQPMLQMTDKGIVF